jgi:predicted acyl esterase
MNLEVKSAAPAYKLLVEKDVDVPMRDGALLKADVFRPDDGGRFPAILNLGPYQKDKLWVPPPNLEEKPNPTMNGKPSIRNGGCRRLRRRAVDGRAAVSRRAVRAVVAGRGDRLLRRHRMGGGAALVQR